MTNKQFLAEFENIRKTMAILAQAVNNIAATVNDLVDAANNAPVIGVPDPTVYIDKGEQCGE